MEITRAMFEIVALNDNYERKLSYLEKYGNGNHLISHGKCRKLCTCGLALT